jgi:DNA-binding MarR family transcriptional regulator
MQVSDVNRSLGDRLHSAAIHLLRRLRRHDEAMGLSPARASALSVVVFGGPVTIGQLARAEQVSPPTMTRLIIGMERDGLVRRDADARDGRVVWLKPTARGARILQAGRRRRVAALAGALDALSAEERRTLTAAADILERLLRPPIRSSRGEAEPAGPSASVSRRSAAPERSGGG